MKRNLLSIVLVAAAVAACGGRAAVQSPVPGNPVTDPELYRLLAPAPMEEEELAALWAYEAQHQAEFMDRIALIAEDAATPTAVRYNAIMLIGERGRMLYLPALRAAMTDRDHRVRAAVVAAAQRMLERNPEPRGLIVDALDDPAEEVRAKALEVLGPDDPALLRDFLRRNPEGAVADIALGLLEVAESRGEPLSPDADGVLRRRTSEGNALEFRPVTRWAQWDASLGVVSITRAGSEVLRLDSIEVVRGVVPVFFSADGHHLVYERGRQVYVRDLESGETIDAGPGIAPRPRPFTDQFIFLREYSNMRAPLRERTRLRYDVVTASFTRPRESTVQGQVNVIAQADRSGNYSPARWLRVGESGMTFRLEGDGIETFPLPSPFEEADPS